MPSCNLDPPRPSRRRARARRPRACARTSTCPTSPPATCCASTAANETELGKRGQGVHGQRRARARRARDRDDPRARSRRRATTASCSTASRARSARPTRSSDELEQRGRRLTAALLIDAPRRRRSSSASPAAACCSNGHVYHVEFDPPKHEGVCDQDGKPLTPARRRQARDDPEAPRDLPRADRAADRVLRASAACCARFDGTRSPDGGARPHPRDARDAAPGRAAVIIKKSPAEIDAMAAAGDILVRCMDLLAGKIRPGVTTLELDAAAEQLHPLAGRRRPRSRATAASRARSARRRTTWSCTASRASSSSSAATSCPSTSAW